MPRRPTVVARPSPTSRFVRRAKRRVRHSRASGGLTHSTPPPGVRNPPGARRPQPSQTAAHRSSIVVGPDTDVNILSCSTFRSPSCGESASCAAVVATPARAHAHIVATGKKNSAFGLPMGSRKCPSGPRVSRRNCCLPVDTAAHRRRQTATRRGSRDVGAPSARRGAVWGTYAPTEGQALAVYSAWGGQGARYVPGASKWNPVKILGCRPAATAAAPRPSPLPHWGGGVGAHGHRGPARPPLVPPIGQSGTRKGDRRRVETLDARPVAAAALPLAAGELRASARNQPLKRVGLRNSAAVGM